MEGVIIKLWWLWLGLGILSFLAMIYQLQAVNLFNRIRGKAKVDRISVKQFIVVALIGSVVTSVFWVLFVCSMQEQLFISLGTLFSFLGIVALIGASRDYKEQIINIQKRRATDRHYPVSELHQTQGCAVVAMTMITILVMCSLAALAFGLDLKFHFNFL